MSGPENPAKSSSSALLVLGKISSILDAFSLSRPVLSLSDIRESTGLPTSTVQRLVTNLMSQGFLDRDEDAYRIGMRMAYWAAPATRGVEVLDIIGPLLKTLRDTTGESACFFQTEQHERVCVVLAETHHALRREMHLGMVLPLHAGSAGRVLLAWDAELMDAVVRDPLKSMTDATITNAEYLVSAVKKTRTDGYAITVGEREDGASGLSAPVFDSTARIVGAVTISGPTLRMPLQTCESWVEPLLATAENMTRLISGRFPGEA